MATKNSSHQTETQAFNFLRHFCMVFFVPILSKGCSKMSVVCILDSLLLNLRYLIEDIWRPFNYRVLCRSSCNTYLVNDDLLVTFWSGFDWALLLVLLQDNSSGRKAEASTPSTSSSTTRRKSVVGLRTTSRTLSSQRPTRRRPLSRFGKV